MKGLAETSGKGRRPALESLRDRLAQDIDDCRSGRDLAALSRQYADVLKQLDEISSDRPGGDTGLSEFQRRLAEREGRRRA